jgi:hypothetical protein
MKRMYREVSNWKMGCAAPAMESVARFLAMID